MADGSEILDWSNRLLDFLISYRQLHPDFIFWLRQRDRGDRLSSGYWFQGNDNYIFLSFWNRSGGTNMTRSIGFVVSPKSEATATTRFEIAFNGEEDKEILKLYKAIIQKYQMHKVHDTKYYVDYEEPDAIKSLQRFLDTVKPEIDAMIRKAGRDDMFIEEAKFNQALKNTLAIRNAAPGPSSQELELVKLIRQHTKEEAIAYFQAMDAVVDKLKLSAEDQRVTFSSKAKGLTLIIGQRYCFTLGRDQGRLYIQLISPGKLNKESDEFEGKPKAYGTNFPNVDCLAKYLPDLLSGCENELNRTNRSGFRKFNDDTFEKATFDKEYRNKVFDMAFVSQTSTSITYWIAQYKLLISGKLPDKKYNEIYKWETVQHFQDNWHDDHSAATMLALLEHSFNESNNNLWTGQNYFPYGMLLGFARNNPGKVSSMFRSLYNEELPLEKRFEDFQKGAGELTKGMFPGEEKEHYQSDRALMVYLVLRYPERYYLYKSRMFREFCELTGFWEYPKVKKKDKITKVKSYATMADSLRKLLLSDQELLRLHQERLPATIKFNDDYHLLTQDFIYSVTRYLNDQAGNELEPDTGTNHNKAMALNQILFGPPGTGKTYHTINEAVRIVDPTFYQGNKLDRSELRRRFKELLITDWNDTKGQIAFCTFHQSFSYEDFVEGIKPLRPKESDDFLKYEIEDGIFKRLCRLSEDSRSSRELKSKSLFSWNEETFGKAEFYKISLGDSNNPDDQAIYDYCIKNNCIALGYGDMNDFSGLTEKEVVAKAKELQLDTFAGQALNYFIHYLKKGNYVLVSNGNRYVRAIGKVTGDYHYDASGAIRFNHFRAVEWLVVNQNVPVSDIYDRNLSQMTIYKLDGSGIKKEFFVAGSQVATPVLDKKFVLIIDEINRGNVSSIFGELITLIEEDKRTGGKEELEVILPYSKERFRVPDNVYIVGTMNTADRSIEALDTALRRRFSFTEMPSKPELIKTEGKLKPTGKLGDLNLVLMLEQINERIGKLVDKDHKIGHSYFLQVATEQDLKEVFRNKVIPLLEEYFFGDFGKIGLVLGDSFVKKDDPSGFEFAKFGGYEDASIVDDLKSRAVFRIAEETAWDFKSIYA